MVYTHTGQWDWLLRPDFKETERELAEVDNRHPSVDDLAEVGKETIYSEPVGKVRLSDTEVVELLSYEFTRRIRNQTEK